MDKQKADKNILNNFFCKAIVSFCGLGYIPIGAGTVAAAITTFIYYFFLNNTTLIISTFGLIIMGWPFIKKAEDLYGEKDPSKIVIDEVIGMSLALWFVPKNIFWLSCSFMLFRLFDIFKISPINKIERLPDAKGVIGDDIVAGLYSNIFIQISRLIIIYSNFRNG